MKLKRIGVLSAGLVSGALYLLLGLIFGALVSMVVMLGIASEGFGGRDGGEFFGLIFGVGAIIFIPLFYGTLGFFLGIITAFFYNLIAKIMGGIEVEFDSPIESSPIQTHHQEH